MALFNRKKKNQTPTKDLSREIGVAGEVVFSSLENEEARTDRVTIKQYREMIDKDPTVESLFNIFTLPIVSATYRIDADEDDAGEEQADFIRKNLFEPPHKGGMETPFTLFQDELVLSIIDGFGMWEKVYKLDGGKYYLKKLAHRDSIGITLIRDDTGGYGGARQVVSYGNKQIDQILPPYKTFLFTHNKARDYLYGRSAFTSLRGPYEKKRRLEYLDSIALQADAIKPKVLVRTQEGTINDDKLNNGKSVKDRALDALSKLGERKAVASLPYGYDIREITQDGRDPHQSIERQNSEMARAFMATFSLMSSQGSSDVGSYALSDNLKDMLMISLKAFMAKVEEHFNQFVIADLINLNYATPHYPEFHYDDLSSDTVQIIADAFMKLIEKDRISDEMVEGIEESTASRLEINLDQIKQERKKRADKEEKAAAKKSAVQSSSNQLSEMSSRDFPNLYESLGINQDDLGCIMLDLQPFDVVKHVPNGEADLVQATDSTDHTMGAVAEIQPHVSLLFGLLQNGNTIKDKVDQVLNGWKCESVVLDDIDSFPVPQDAAAVPIVAKLWNPDLREANSRLSLLPHVNTFGEYTPHVTLAYVKNDPDVVQKWVKALRAVLGGMRVSSTGINYGDLPEDNSNDGGSAGNGGKFLSEGANKWWRPLTPAEGSVRFSELNSKMDSFESAYIKAAEPILNDFVRNLVDSGVTTQKIQDIKVDLPKEYSALLASTIKTAYNYAKIGAADEHNVPAPATSSDAIAGMKEMVDFVTSKQQDDIRGIIADERLKQQTSLADDEKSSILKTTLLTALAAWILGILKPTASATVGRAVNNGRDDVFQAIQKPEDLYQYSGILDIKICPLCKSLDGSVITPEEYAKTRWKPPLHFHCRCIWVLIRKIAPGYKMPEVTGIDDEKISEIDRVMTTKKQDLIDEGTLGTGQTKKSLVGKVSGTDFTGSTMTDFEDSVRANKFETGAVIGSDGNVVASFAGQRSQVEIPTDIARGKVVTHNHPSGSSFSLQDLKTASTLDLSEVRAFGTKYSYSMKPGENGWPSTTEIDKARKEAIQEANETLKKRVRDVKPTKEELVLEFSNEINSIIANKLGLIYTRKGV